MASWKFDGTKLKRGGTVVANVRGDSIRKGSGTTTVCNIRGDTIRNGNGTSAAFNVRGEVIRKGNGTSRVATMKDVDKDIDGPGNVVKAALWLYFVR